MTPEELFNALAGIIKPITDERTKTKAAPVAKKKSHKKA